MCRKEDRETTLILFKRNTFMVYLNRRRVIR